MAICSGALDKSVFDGKTISLKIGEENDRHRYVYFGGKMLCSFLNNDNICKNISNMGINLTPYSVALGEKNVNFLTPRFKNINKEKIKDDNLFKSYDYHISKWGKDSFKKIRNI